MSDDAYREFLLSSLRAASLRAKLFEIDVNSIGVALKGGMISVSEALEWAKDIGALESMGVIPKEILAVSGAIVTTNREQEAER